MSDIELIARLSLRLLVTFFVFPQLVLLLRGEPILAMICYPEVRTNRFGFLVNDATH